MIYTKNSLTNSYNNSSYANHYKHLQIPDHIEQDSSTFVDRCVLKCVLFAKKMWCGILVIHYDKPKTTTVGRTAYVITPRAVWLDIPADLLLSTQNSIE